MLVAVTFLTTSVSFGDRAQGATAGPSCVSGASDDYMDGLGSQADGAAAAGRHVVAMRLYQRLGDYVYKCVRPATAAITSDARDPSLTNIVRSMRYLRASWAYIDAAQEARIAGRGRDRCLLAARALEAHYRAYPNERPSRNAKPSRQEAALLRGC